MSLRPLKTEDFICANFFGLSNQWLVVVVVFVVAMPPLPFDSPRHVVLPTRPVISNWGRLTERLMMRLHLKEARSAQRCALTDLKIPKVLRKIPEPSLEQWDCPHEHLRKRSNQYGAHRVCKACNLPMLYLPTPLGIETAKRPSKPRTMTRPEARSLLQGQGRQRDESTLSAESPESPGSPGSLVSPLSPWIPRIQAAEQAIHMTEQMVQTLTMRQAQTRRAMNGVLREMMAGSNEADGGDSTSSFQMVEDVVESST